MIFILHGENITASRNFILELQDKYNYRERIELSLSETSSQELHDICVSQDIFGKPPFVVLDISKPGKTNFDEYTEKLIGLPKDLLLFFLSSVELSPSNSLIKSAAVLGAKIIVSKGQKISNIFRFVDFVFEAKRKEAYKEYNKLINFSEDDFYTFSMLLYGLRNISYKVFDSPSFSKLPPFVKSKIQNQAKLYSNDFVRRLYRDLYLLEKDAKTGRLSQDMLVPLAIEKILFKK